MSPSLRHAVRKVLASLSVFVGFTRTPWRLITCHRCPYYNGLRSEARQPSPSVYRSSLLRCLLIESEERNGVGRSHSACAHAPGDRHAPSTSRPLSLCKQEPDFLDRDELELGGAGQRGPKGVVKDTAASIASLGAGLENGELALWDPAKILVTADDALIMRNSTHTGPIRGLDFNPIQTSLIASGAVSGEVYIWDLHSPAKPYTPTPGARSTKLDEMTSVAWNRQVQYVLAGASNTGYTVVWDLRGKHEVVALAYGGGGGSRKGRPKADSREELVALLVFEKAEIERKVREEGGSRSSRSEQRRRCDVKVEELEPTARESVVSFADQEEGSEKAPSEVSAATSVSVSGTSQTAITASESESTTTAPSLFGDENAAGGDAGDGADASLDSSVAATVGSRPSSAAASDTPTKGAGAFNIYPASASPTDRLITQALMLGDFEYAVSLCLASSRFADAICSRSAAAGAPAPHAGRQGGSGRVLQAVVNADLSDVVRNADEKGEFEGLVEELGARRLERRVAQEDDQDEGKMWRKNATLAYLAAGKLERLVGIWNEELIEDETKALDGSSATC
ncbi:hypothetical protein C8R47DRAFT_1238783 [Mycena vitilis]|nr:hypothetical protein C8R47DRAFT_1238783 [Mycena vitilis]